MKKFFMFLIFFNLMLSAEDKLQNMSLLELFNNKYYTYICDKRWDYINKYNNKREDLLSLVAYACLKKRYLTPALDLAKVLKVTKESRENASYIVTLFLMKKLLMQIINDNMPIGDIKLPKINDNTLGVVFSFIEKNKFEKKDKTLIIKDGNTIYKVAISKNNNIVIDVLVNNQLKKREFYW